MGKKTKDKEGTETPEPTEEPVKDNPVAESPEPKEKPVKRKKPKPAPPVEPGYIKTSTRNPKRFRETYS